MRWWQFSSNG
jgi:hypothetical protein